MGTFDFETDFSIDDFNLEIDVSFKTRIIKPPKQKELKEYNLKYDNALKLANDISINKAERYFVIINGSFYFGDFIEALVKSKPYHVKKMIVSTLSLNENNVDSFANLLNGGFVDSLDLIVSDYFYSHERSNLIPYIYKELDKGNKFQLAAAGSHCKLCIFETHCGKFVVIHGSANLRTSGNIEQIVIEENKELYKFNLKYQSQILQVFKTINKSIRGRKLFDEIIKD